MNKNNLSTFLLILYLVCVIPVIAIYFYHGHHEIQESFNLDALGNETKATKTFAEGGFLIGSAAGYIWMTALILKYPTNKIPYLVVLVGTVIIIVIYYARAEYGVPIPFTNLEIHKFAVGWEGFWTKILQQILVIPISMLLIIRATKLR